MKLYVGCSLTKAPQEFIQRVEDIKTALRTNHEVMDFVGLVNGADNDVYRGDIHKNIADCEAFIAICDLPAIGLGYELGVAVEKLQKPVLAVAHIDAKVSRLVKGIDQSNFEFKRYTDTAELIEIIEAFLKRLTT